MVSHILNLAGADDEEHFKVEMFRL